MAEDKISFLVIAYNSLETTKKCIESLLKFEKDSEILFLDNGSSEPVYPYFNNVKEIKTFRSEKNLGVVGGRNFLLNKATGVYLVFVDNDVELISSVGERIRKVLSDIWIGVYGKTGIMFSDELHPFAVLNNEVDAISGFFQAFRRQLIEEIGKLDENFIMYWDEDMDFCLRAKKAGYKIIADGTLPIIHHEHKSSSTVKNLKDFVIKNQEYFYNKWKDSLDVLEIEKKKINHLSCLNCAETWDRKE